MRDALFPAMSGKRPAMPAHGSHPQITLFGAGSAESQQTEADAHIGRSGASSTASLVTETDTHNEHLFMSGVPTIFLALTHIEID
jgi:hypothetical protein